MYDQKGERQDGAAIRGSSNQGGNIGGTVIATFVGLDVLRQFVVAVAETVSLNNY